MGNVLQGLLNGKIIPWERPNDQSKAFLDAVGKAEKGEEVLLQMLTPAGEEQFQRVKELWFQLTALEGEHDFSCGFALGLLLALEAEKEAELLYNE